MRLFLFSLILLMMPLFVSTAVDSCEKCKKEIRESYRTNFQNLKRNINGYSEFLTKDNSTEVATISVGILADEALFCKCNSSCGTGTPADFLQLLSNLAKIAGKWQSDACGDSCEDCQKEWRYSSMAQSLQNLSKLYEEKCEEEKRVNECKPFLPEFHKELISAMKDSTQLCASIGCKKSKSGVSSFLCSLRSLF